jgi:hypothetical protein
MVKSKPKRFKNREIQEARNGFVQMPRQLAYSGDVITKRLTFTNSYITNNSVLGVQLKNTGTVQSDSATEWASFAARYQQYRVKALSVTFYFYQNSGYLGSPFVVSDYLGTAIPGSSAQILSDERCVVRANGGQNGSSMFVYETDWSRNLNAKLWNPTNAVIPAANVYGIAFASHPQASPTIGGTNITQLITTDAWLVEFRGSQ